MGQLGLQRVGVLELVDQQAPVTIADRAANLVVGPKHPARFDEKVVEGESALLTAGLGTFQRPTRDPPPEIVHDRFPDASERVGAAVFGGLARVSHLGDVDRPVVLLATRRRQPFDVSQHADHRRLVGRSDQRPQPPERRGHGGEEVHAQLVGVAGAAGQVGDGAFEVSDDRPHIHRRLGGIPTLLGKARQHPRGDAVVVVGHGVRDLGEIA